MSGRKKPSIRARIMLWYGLLILLVLGLLTALLLWTQYLQSKDYYYRRLTEVAASASRDIHLGANGEIELDTQIDDNVHVTVLDENGELLIGKRKFAAKPKEEVLRIRENRRSDASWYLLDQPVTLADGRQLWIRCYASSAVAERMGDMLRLVMLLSIPLMLAAVFVGGFMMTRYIFRPMDEMIATARSISNSSDLKRRIDVSGAQREVDRLVSTFNEMLARLERSVENEKRFISDASHELRTPMSVIRAQSEYALSPDCSPEERENSLQVILECSTRASDMISQMLALSRMDARRQQLEREPINISEMIESIAEQLEPLAAQRQIGIQVACQPNLILNCDEILMMRALFNLMQNAIEYGREGGHVWVSAGREHGGTVIRVRDDGCGISEDDCEKIWRRFYRVRSTAAQGGGTGLGLPMAQQIVAQHGGTIGVTSVLGSGSEFTIRFEE